MEQLTLMEKFADPSHFYNLGLGEKMIGAGVTTLMGMGITFIVLILLSAIIIFMEKIFLKSLAFLIVAFCFVKET